MGSCTILSLLFLQAKCSKLASTCYAVKARMPSTGTQGVGVLYSASSARSMLQRGWASRTIYYGPIPSLSLTAWLDAFWKLGSRA